MEIKFSTYWLYMHMYKTLHLDFLIESYQDGWVPVGLQGKWSLALISVSSDALFEILILTWEERNYVNSFDKWSFFIFHPCLPETPSWKPLLSAFSGIRPLKECRWYPSSLFLFLRQNRGFCIYQMKERVNS